MVRVGGPGILKRIEAGLDLAEEILGTFLLGTVNAERKHGGELVTEADRAVDVALREALPKSGEGWLSEETKDDGSRLRKKSVWIVDPVDGTHEFVSGIPEWCVSVGFVVAGHPVAGGILNPRSGERFLGALGEGMWYNNVAVQSSRRQRLDGSLVLASRSEVRRGEWDRYENEGFTVRAVGSVAYKLALVAAGRADATWTLVPKNEWDVAAGAALVLASGGCVYEPSTGLLPEFNRRNTLLSGFAAHPAGLFDDVSKQTGQALAR